MLLVHFVSILAMAGVLAVAADDPPQFAPPEILVSDGDSDSQVLMPHIGNPVRTEDAVDDTKVIRGLLMRSVKRQSCSAGDGLCNGGGCCPYGANCCNGGGCCQAGYYCTVVNGQKGCCAEGGTCNDGSSGPPGGCFTNGYYPCYLESFCCPKGYTCSRDSANNPECYYDWNSGTHTPSPTYNTVTPSYSYYSPNGGNNGPADSNNPNNGSGNPSATFISTSSRSSSRTSSIPTSSPTGFPASNAQSGAVSNRMGPLSFVGVSPVLLLIGVGLWC